MEVEVKYSIQNTKEAESKLRALPAQFLYEKEEVDTYYSVAGRNSLETKECLRIRVTGNKAEITYKPPSNEQDVQHFAKKEVNLDIKDPQTADMLLRDLGNTPLVTVVKTRKSFSYKDCVIALDTIKDVGTFLEIESESKTREEGLAKIRECANVLGLKDQDIRMEPYRDMVLAAKRR